MDKLFLILFILIISLTVLEAQTTDSCAFKIGTNLSGLVDYGSEWPFKDIMKYCRSWGTQNILWYNGGQNPWDSNLADSILKDDDGYPLELPFVWPGTDTSQMFYTVWANTASLPAGIYVCLYDGQGVIDFWGDASIINQTPGRIEVLVTPGVVNIMQMKIKVSMQGNHIHNIRFLVPGTENNFMVDPYNPEWIEKLEPFNYLRFMDWGLTNNSFLRHWGDRPLANDYTYTISGIPYEEMTRICNVKQADAWVCVPHLADSNYIQQLATLFRDSLDPGLKIYVEYSNEIWNWMFDQAHYCNDSLDQSIPWPERLGPKIGSVMDIWSDVFAGQMSRIERVCGVQIGWMDVAQRTISSVPLTSIDLVSPTSYIGLNGDSLNFYGASLNRNKVFDLAHQSLYQGISSLHQIYHYADSIGYDGMVYYEGGQHFTPIPFGTVQPYNDTLVACQTDPRMYDLYMEMFDSLRAVTQSDSSLFMNFAFIKPPSGQYGSWGVLESLFYQFPPYQISAPKYQALLDNIPNCDIISSISSENSSNNLAVIFPNPCSSGFSISIPEHFHDARVCIFDIRGKLVFSGQIQPGINNFEQEKNLSTGIFILQISNDDFVQTEKLIIHSSF